MKLIALVLALSLWSLAQSPPISKTSSQLSNGNCSPNIVSNGNGPVTVQFNGQCSGVDTHVLNELTRSLQKFLADYPRTESASMSFWTKRTLN
jgi:hypothetical protein